MIEESYCFCISTLDVSETTAAGIFDCFKINFTDKKDNSGFDVISSFP